MSKVIQTSKVRTYVNDMYKQLGQARNAASGPRVNVSVVNEIDKMALILAHLEEELGKHELFHNSGGKL